jgi:hypothetical protein
MARKQSPFITYLKEAWLNALVKEKPRKMSLYDWFLFLFCVEERPILISKAWHGFELPGTFMFEGVHPIEGSLEAPRSVREGAMLFVRKDAKSVFYEVETSSAVFRLTAKEWQGIKKYVELPHPDWPDSRCQ